MKFKYFLRGLGIGIIFTSIIMLTAYQGSASKELTDDEIIRRAKGLGMIEKEDPVAGLLSDKTESKETGNTKDSSKKEKKSEENTDTENDASEDTTEETTTEGTTTEAENDSPEAKEDESDTVVLTISGGSSSYPVCERLVELGMIKNAAEFDTYLVENGYAARLRVGTHTLKKGMSYRDIAEAISDPL